MKRISSQTLATMFAITLAFVLAPAPGFAQTVSFGQANQPGQQKLSGRVTDPSGAPVANLEVSMVPRFAAPVRTDASGSYEFNWHPPGAAIQIRMSIMARDTAHNLAAIQPISQTTTNVDLQLKNGITLAVKALDAAGNPITVATGGVTLFTDKNNSMGLSMQALADANGLVEATALPAGMHYQLNVTAPGYGSTALNVESDQTTGKRFDFPTVTLPKADRQLAGRVLDANGKPAGGVNVSVSGGSQPNASTRTDDQGKFRFNQIAPGTAMLFANYQNNNANVETTAGETNVTIRMNAAGANFQPNGTTTSGTVTDASGAPVVGAHVSTVSPIRGIEVLTDSDGHYSITWQALPNYPIPTMIVARDTTRNLSRMERVDERTTNRNLKLDQSVTLAVKVADIKGQPIPNATAQTIVTLDGGNGGSYGTLLDTTPVSADANGLIEVKGLPAKQQYSLTIQATGYGSANASAPAGDTTPGKRIEFPATTLKIADRQLSGRVLDSRGKPAAGASVTLFGNGQTTDSTRADSQGRFKFERVVEGPAMLQANTANGTSDNIQFGSTQANGGDTNAVLRLGVNQQIVSGRGAVTTTGRVYGTNGAPAAGVQMRLWPPFSSGPSGIYTDDDGKYSISWAPRTGDAQAVPGLLAMDEEHNLAVGEVIENSTTSKDLRLKPGLTISGSVRDETGGPLTTATVQLQFYGGTMANMTQQPALVDSTSGTFEFHALPQGGQYGLIVAADTFPPKTVILASTATETTHLKLEPIVLKHDDLVFAGQVLGESGRPAANVNISIRQQNQTIKLIHSDARGHFSTKVGEGTYTVSFVGPTSAGTASLTGANPNYVFHLGSDTYNSAAPPSAPGPLTISGRITDPAGAPAPNVLIVSPAPTGGASGGMRTDADGRYTINYQPPAPARDNPTAGRVFLIVRDVKNNLAGKVELDNKTTTVDLRLSPGLTVSGSVTDGGTSKPVPTARLLTTNYLSVDNNALRYQQETITVESDGSFEITGLPQGSMVGMRVEGGTDGYGAVNRLIGPPDTDAPEVKLPPIAVRPFNLRLAGDIQNEDGSPVPNAVFFVRGPGFPNPRFQTDARGHFDIKTADGPNYVTVTSPVAMPQVTFQGGDTHIVIKPGSAAAQPRGGGGGNAARAGFPRTVPVAARVGGTMPVMPLPDAGGVLPAGTVAANIVVTGTDSSGAAVTSQVRVRTAAAIRVGRGRLNGGNWLAGLMQPAEHSTLFLGLAAAQLFLLAGVGGGVWFFTRRPRT